MRIRLLLFILLGSASVLMAQTPDPKTVQTDENLYEDAGLLYRNEATGGLIVNSHGFGLSYRRGKHITAARKGIWEFEFVNYRHPKEVRTTNPFFDNAKGYYYGKLNSFFIFRTGVGFQNTIYTKPEKNGVEIRWVAFVGGSLGIAKPVYLEILYDNAVPGTKLVKTERYDPAKHFPDQIYGRAPFVRGLGEIGLRPGGYGKVGLNFEYGPMDTEIRSLEVGFIVDVYATPVKIMATEREQMVLLTLYLQFNMGRKWF
jgi:hypothetical protein